MGVLRAGAAAADPGAAVRDALEMDGDRLHLLPEPGLDLSAGGSLRLVGAGKAAASMAAAALERLGGRVAGGSITLPHGAGRPLPPLDVWEAAHPVPDIGGLAGASDALATARAAGEGDVLLCLLSGGASSLWAAPAPGLTLSDLQAVTVALLRSGAPIEAMNVVRKHLSRIAGGGLARAARPARVLTLAISDVIGAGDDAIGSGPTLPDPTTFADALEVVRRYDVALPAAALHHLRVGASGAVAETAKPGELDNVLAFRIVLSVREALAGAEEEARRLGYAVRVVSAELTGEARDAGARVAVEALRARAAGEGPVALLWGGETTVTVR
ncbi:MAG TPA: DUF4147 domain-containing protein, partial [Longimicrobium sp.]|nr:DUF4147 domain-containing protein [Longimicrobium sp.]